MSSVLVTGGAGFIGSNLARGLASRGFKVTVLDDLSTGHRANLDEIMPQIRFVEGSILDEAALDEAMKGVEAILHQAAVPSVPKSVAQPLLTHSVNATGTLMVLEAARQRGIKRVVFAASSSVYGDHEAPAKHEALPTHPLSPYAIQKLTSEHYLRVYHELFGMDTIGLRYFNVFGPHQDPKSDYAAVLPLFITKRLRGERPTIYGDGLQSRDFTYVENVVEANLAALRAGPEASGQLFNIACGERITLLEVLAILDDLIGHSSPPRFEPPRPGDIKHSLADISKAQRVLGWRVHVSTREGLSRTVAWLKEHSV
ncbi:SDR family oxidoreductase [Myxococcota bacterium]|nr:SDR family oxidoreductase [Myxococcota bacterium]MBU1432035.1 SDR family oxidoreductase [Myxococcota bacterium]MBU1899019.1 SDR family oxidoreductase [Myxococcota bacterium]